MKLGIYSIEKTLFEGDVKEIIAKTTTGEISILPDHIPLVTQLVKAPLKLITNSDEKKEIHIDSGFLEVQPENSIVVLVDA
jgi:F-type H+-transporting ATPase subunit epsilon